MKKSILIFAAIVMMAGLTTTLMAQSNTASSNAGVKIVTALTLTSIANLNFGTMTVPTGGVNITLSTSTGLIASVPANIVLLAQTPIPQNAAYTVAGSANSTYAITLPTGNTTINGPNSAYTIVNNFVAKTASAGVDGLTGTLDGSGTDSFVVGARLQLAGAQGVGVYTGSFNVSVNYN